MSSRRNRQDGKRKHVIKLRQAFYPTVDFLQGKTSIPSKTISADVMLKLSFTMRDVLKGNVVHKTLQELACSEDTFDLLVPRHFAGANAYVSKLHVLGFANNSLVTFYAGFTDFERAIYAFAEANRPALLDERIIKKLKNTDADSDFFSFHIQPTHLFSEPGDPIQQAIDEQEASGDVHRLATPAQGVCGHPSFKIVHAEMHLFKGVTASNIERSCMRAGNYIDTPLTSLLANIVRAKDSVMVCSRDSYAGEYTATQDTIMSIPLDYAKTLREELLGRAESIRRTCMYDIKNMRMAFLPMIVVGRWNYDEETDTLIDMQSGENVDLDKTHDLHIRLSVEAVYVLNTENTAAFMSDMQPAIVEELWRQEDVNVHKGTIRHGAKPVYTRTSESERKEAGTHVKRASHDVDTRQEDDEERSQAASSTPVLNDD